MLDLPLPVLPEIRQTTGPYIHLVGDDGYAAGPVIVMISLVVHTQGRYSSFIF